MPTLILSPRYSEDSQALWRAAVGLGWPVERLINWRLSDELKRVPEPVLYLEVLMAEAIAPQLGVRLLNVSHEWLPKLPEVYRKRSIALSTLGEARQLTTPAFVKPPNDKSFPAQIYQAGELPADYPDATPVLIAEIVEWEKEFRCFILDRSLKTFSIYLRNGELQEHTDFSHSPAEEIEVRSFIETLLADQQVEILPAAAIDIGVIRDRGWAVVEQNAPWAAGLYGCDPVEVLFLLRSAVVKL